MASKESCKVLHCFTEHGKIVHHGSSSPALCSSSRTPQLAQLGTSQLVSSIIARPTQHFAAVSSTEALPAQPFTDCPIHHGSPSSALRSSCYPPQLVQLGPSQLVLFTAACPARPFAAFLIHQRSPCLALHSSSHPLQFTQPQFALRSLYHQPQLAQLRSSQLVSFTTARPTLPFAARLSI